MGTACCCITFFCSLESSDWIHLIGILINSGLAIWIVRTIQNKLTNRRVLKDHFISEIKEIRNEYRNYMNNLCSNNIYPKRAIPWFKLMNIKIEDLMSCINDKYNIDKKSLLPYQNELRELITENVDFIQQFKSGKLVVFSEQSLNSFIKFQQENNQLFNHLIIKVNDSK